MTTGPRFGLISTLKGTRPSRVAQILLINLLVTVGLFMPILVFNFARGLERDDVSRDKLPWLRWFGNAGTSVAISWETEQEATSSLAFGSDPDTLVNNVTLPGLRTMHHVYINGLVPGTRYYYTVASTDGVYSFWTAPATSNGSFTFLAIADTQESTLGINHHPRVAKALAREVEAGAKFLIHGGDFADSGYSKPSWQYYFKHAAPYSDRAAVFVEPLAAACQIPNQVHIRPGQRVVVLGDGKLGLLAAQVLALTGCHLTAVGRHPAKLDILARRGIDTFCVAAGDELPDACADLVVECTGSPSGFLAARRLVRPRGTLVLKSTYHGTIQADLSALVVDEINRLALKSDFHGLHQVASIDEVPGGVDLKILSKKFGKSAAYHLKKTFCIDLKESFKVTGPDWETGGSLKRLFYAIRLHSLLAGDVVLLPSRPGEPLFITKILPETVHLMSLLTGRTDHAKPEALSSDTFVFKVDSDTPATFQVISINNADGTVNLMNTDTYEEIVTRPGPWLGELEEGGTVAGFVHEGTALFFPRASTAVPGNDDSRGGDG